MSDLEPEPQEPQHSVSGIGRLVLPSITVKEEVSEPPEESADSP